jgi:hypothetical protein
MSLQHHGRLIILPQVPDLTPNNSEKHTKLGQTETDDDRNLRKGIDDINATNE